MAMNQQTINCAIVGLGFGAEFLPIFQAHPNVKQVAICDLDASRRNTFGDAYGIGKRFTSFEELLADPEIDAVHINSGLFDHAWMTIAALRAGKHVMCAVPMALTIADCEAIVNAVAETGKKYMMAETVVYSREYLYVKQLHESGALGEVQYMQASHTQNMAGWPEYWQRIAPMHYTTHVVSPILDLVNGRAEYVSCFGSGAIDKHLAERSGNRFAVESCNIKIRDRDLSAHIWRFLHNTARQYRESFDVYGTRQSFEWGLTFEDEPALHTAGEAEDKMAKRISVPDFAHLLPQEIRRFTQRVEDEEHPSFIQGGGHGGSHPHLVHAFVSAIVNDSPTFPDAVTAANWTCTGICAHESTQQGGAIVYLPAFTLQE